VEHPKPGADYYLRVAYHHKSRKLMGRKRFEVESDQFKLPINTLHKVEFNATKPVTSTQDVHSIKLSGPGFSVVIDKKSGLISQLNKGNVNLIVLNGGPQVHLWRAPHRNDDMWAYRLWEKYGVQNLQHSLLKINVQQVNRNAVNVTVLTKSEGKKALACIIPQLTLSAVMVLSRLTTTFSLPVLKSI
jgi:beta-galactosidase